MSEVRVSQEEVAVTLCGWGSRVPKFGARLFISIHYVIEVGLELCISTVFIGLEIISFAYH